LRNGSKQRGHLSANQHVSRKEKENSKDLRLLEFPHEPVVGLNAREGITDTRLTREGSLGNYQHGPS